MKPKPPTIKASEVNRQLRATPEGSKLKIPEGTVILVDERILAGLPGKVLDIRRCIVQLNDL